MPRGSKPGERRGGRTKGTPNHLTAQIKDRVVQAFDQLGGVAALVEWAREQPTEFYKLWGRMAPQQSEVSGLGSGPLEVVLRHVDES